MITLLYGYKKPQTNDRGVSLFNALEENIQRLNDHTHDGTNSAQISPLALVKPTQTILAAGWVATAGGRYRQEITLPAGYLYATTQMQFRTAAGESVVPNTQLGSAPNKYYIYTNDNTVALTGLYV